MTQAAFHPISSTPAGSDSDLPVPGPLDRRRALFDDRYGAGAHVRLLEQLADPCVSFAAIAVAFGVTRERVRQWHQAWLPAAPTGRERRRLCAIHAARRRLLQDDLFRSFHRHARAVFGARRIEPLPSRTGYRTRLVRIDNRLIALRDASDTGPRYRGRADFVYFRLADGDFLFVPTQADTTARAHEFKNTFTAFDRRPERSARPAVRHAHSPKESSR